MAIIYLIDSKNSKRILPYPNPDQFASVFISQFRGEPIEKWEGEKEFRLESLKGGPTDFLYLNERTLAFTEEVLMSDFGDLLCRAGELLDGRLVDSQEPIYVINITAVYNCTKIDETDLASDPKRIIFQPGLIGDSSLFKIPQAGELLLTISGEGSEFEDFYLQYIESGFKGLNFVKVGEQ